MISTYSLMSQAQSSSTNSPTAATGHRKRTSSNAKPPTSHALTGALRSLFSSHSDCTSGAASGLPAARGFAQPLRPIPGSPRPHEMSLDRTPSPTEGGGWHSPGLTAPRRSPRRHSPSPRRAHFDTAANGVTWESAQARAVQVNGFPVSPRSDHGFFRRNLRSLSSSLPRFYPPQEKAYAQKEKLGRGRIPTTRWGRAKNFLNVLWRQAWRSRKRLMILLCFMLFFIMFYVTRRLRRRPSLGLGYS